MSESKLLSSLPAAVRPYVERAIAMVSGLSRPAKILLATTAVAAALITAYMTVKPFGPGYVVLFANMDRDDASSVVAKLKEMKVPYRLEGDGAIIEVPESQARELRLELAGAGLPRGGAVGFESFDKMRLGATEFEQRILYRRALEGELSRTIGSLGSVQTARVHLVLPEKSVFVSKNEPASASVVVKLRQGRALGAGEVGSVVHLVSSSVAGLTPDHVTLVTTEGTVLHKPRRSGDDGSASDDERATQARSLEATLEERARALVEKVVGPGHVDVRVTADLDTSRVERVEDRYDPTRTVVRSEERSTERAGESTTVAGVPGAESNIPTGAARGADADGGVATGGGTTREQVTRNFEVDHIVEKRIQSGGTLRRITVAVVVDASPAPGAAPRPAAEIERIAVLVKSAVGADEKRGDQVTVEAVPFLATEAPPAAAPATTPFDYKKHWKALAGAGGAAVVLLVVATILLRRRSRRAKAKAAALAAKEAATAQKTTIAVVGDEMEDPEAALRDSEELRAQVNDRALSDPATAAMVLRAWLGVTAGAGTVKTTETAPGAKAAAKTATEEAKPERADRSIARAA